MLGSPECCAQPYTYSTRWDELTGIGTLALKLEQEAR